MLNEYYFFVCTKNVVLVCQNKKWNTRAHARAHTHTHTHKLACMLARTRTGRVEL